MRRSLFLTRQIGVHHVHSFSLLHVLQLLLEATAAAATTTTATTAATAAAGRVRLQSSPSVRFGGEFSKASQVAVGQTEVLLFDDDALFLCTVRRGRGSESERESQRESERERENQTESDRQTDRKGVSVLCTSLCPNGQLTSQSTGTPPWPYSKWTNTSSSSY